jgi:hypothetical protein
MENSDSNTANVPSNSDSLSLNNAINPRQPSSNSDCWLREFIKINQCPQREDALENQLSDLSLVAEKLGMYYAAHFIKNINTIKK